MASLPRQQELAPLLILDELYQGEEYTVRVSSPCTGRWRRLAGGTGGIAGRAAGAARANGGAGTGETLPAGINGPALLAVVAAALQEGGGGAASGGAQGSSAAALGGGGGGTVHSSRPFLPVVLVTREKRERKDVWNRRQIMYSMSLVGSLGFLFYMRQYIPGDYERMIFFVCATIWGLATVGFPVGLFSQSRFELDCSRHCSRFIFLGFSLLVLYMMYRMMLPAPPSSDTHRAPSASPTPASPADSLIGWTIAYIILAVVVMAGHLGVWALACCRGDDRDDVDPDEEQEVWTDLTVRVTGVWTGFTARVNGVIEDWLAWLAEKLNIIDLSDGFNFDFDDDFDLLAGR